MSNNTYTQEQLDIALLKNTNEGILNALYRLESKIDSNIHWTMGLIFGFYALICVSALAKLFNLF